MVCLWIVLRSLVISLRTLHRRHSSPLKMIPGPESVNWLYDHVFDIFDEPLASIVTKWINQRAYSGGLMHFFGLFGSSYIIPTTPETLKDVLSTHAYDYEKASAFKKYTTDQPIPKNTFVGLCTRAINHAEHLWGPDAAAFRPERWLERSAEGPGLLISPLGGAPASVCMLSFFHGTRSCVGRDLALAQMKRQIAVVVRRFRLETVGRVEEVRPCRLFATTPAPDLLVRFTELEG